MDPKAKHRPPDPPPEIFKRTPEQKRADEAALEAEVKRMKARGEESDLRTYGTPVARAVGKLDLGGLLERAQEWQAERRALPCWRAVYPAQVPDDFLSRRLDTAKVIDGRRACIDAGAFDAGCRYQGEGPTCLYNRALATRERAATRLSLGLGKEAEDEHKLVLAASDPDKPQALDGTDPMLVARRWLAGDEGRVPIINGAQLAPLTGEITSAGVVAFKGDERLVVFGGNPGRGKTVAGVYAIARKGGLYVLDYQLGRPFDVDAAVGVGGVLVVDQLQPTDPDEARRAARRLDEIAHRRFAAGRKTLIIGNVDYLAFARRLGEVESGKVKHPGIIAERCAQAGAFVLFGGKSIRAAS
jgi:hypothetical protein